MAGAVFGWLGSTRLAWSRTWPAARWDPVIRDAGRETGLLDYEVPPLAERTGDRLPLDVAGVLLGLFRACAETGIALEAARLAERRANAEISAAEFAEAGTVSSAASRAAHRRFGLAAGAASDFEALFADEAAQFAVAAVRAYRAVWDGRPPTLDDVDVEWVDFGAIVADPDLLPLVGDSRESEADALRQVHRRLHGDLAAARGWNAGRIVPATGYIGWRWQLADGLYDYAHACCYELAHQLRHHSHVAPLRRRPAPS